MATYSNIEWTEMTWNPVTGCTKVSAGCKNCYAEKLAKRLKAMGVERYRNGFKVTLQPDLLEVPLHWREPRVVFVNSMSPPSADFMRKCRWSTSRKSLTRW